MNDDNVGLSLGLGVGEYYSRSLSFSVHPKDEPARSTDDDDDPDVTIRTRNDDFSRKKLRLSKEQSSLLEDTFKSQTTLNPVQKQELAERLKLKPRQVEVWFQNRRARTKLKQTEVDCEFLRRCCEGLSDENRRLKKELLDLKSAPPPPFYLHLRKAASTSSHGVGESEERSD